MIELVVNITITVCGHSIRVSINCNYCFVQDSCKSAGMKRSRIQVERNIINNRTREFCVALPWNVN